MHAEATVNLNTILWSRVEKIFFKNVNAVYLLDKKSEME